MKKNMCVIMLSLMLLGGRGIAGNWPTWRGPECMGISPDGDPPIEWSETENIKWKAAVRGDKSDSTPIAWGDMLIYQSAEKTGKSGPQKVTSKPDRFSGPVPRNIYKFNLVCVDRQTGKTMWEQTAVEAQPHQGHHPDHGFASYCPVTDGKHIWANFGSRGVYCYDMSGEKLWGVELSQLNAKFGEGGSTAIAGDALIVVADSAAGNSSIYAFDKVTGDVLWHKGRSEKEVTYATPLPVKINGRQQVIVNSWDKIMSYDVKTGDIVWECGGPQRNGIYTPVTDGDVLYCVTQVNTHIMQAIRLDRTGDLLETDAILWQNVNAATPDIASLLLYKDRLYSFAVFNEELSCYNISTGKPYFEKQKLAEMKKIYASPVAASGRIYCTGRNGVTYVLKAAEEFEVLAINKLDDGIDCSPVIVDNELYLKGKKYIYCIAEN